MIPVDAARPENSYEPEMESPPRLKRILYQLVRNNHYAIYEFLQIDLAYSSCSMTNNRLTRYQIGEVYRTGKVSTVFGPMKVDDLLEIVNHFRCVHAMLEVAMQPLTVPLIKQPHSILTTGTIAVFTGKCISGIFRTEENPLGLPPQDISKTFPDFLRIYGRSPHSLEQLLSFHITFEQISTPSPTTTAVWDASSSKKPSATNCPPSSTRTNPEDPITAASGIMTWRNCSRLLP